MYLFIIYLFIFLIGISIGSFLNVVSLRAFSNESIVFPPSKCPKCNNRLKWWHNIPILSFIFLKGKCGFCEEKISIQYPIVELVTGIFYVGVVFEFGLTFQSLFLCILCSFFMLIMITDFKEQVVFDYHTYPIIALGLIYNVFHLGSTTIIDSILGVLLGIVVFEGLARLGCLMVKTRAFGEGDTIIAMGLGAFFGWKYLIIITVLSFFMQVVVSLPLMMYKTFKNKDYKTFIAFSLMLFCIALSKINTYFIDKEPFWLTLLLLLITAIILIYSVCVIMAGIKTRKNMTYLPFGPALVMAALVVLFFSNYFVTNYFPYLK